MPLSAGSRRQDRPHPMRQEARQSGQAGADARRRLALHALGKPRTQAELRDILNMSNSGVLQLLRRLEREGVARPAEKLGWTRVWQKVPRT